MKFVALVSGGKDSIYCIMKCLEFGHELVAIANLTPPDLKLGMRLLILRVNTQRELIRVRCVLVRW